MPQVEPLRMTHYQDRMTKSATLPAYSNGGRPYQSYIGTDSATLQARLLPGYANGGIIGNIHNRQRHMSSSSYSTRQRTSSQSSLYSRRQPGINRVTSTHIPEHIDRRLVRSRSVGVISDAEMKMRRTDSASVIKLSECEDWIV